MKIKGIKRYINEAELIYCGNILDDDSTLQSCGLKPGVMVHVLKKKEKDIPLPVRSMTEADVQELVMAFRTFTRHPSYRSALHRLSRPEVLENIMMATPGLSDDPVALSIIQDPELLVHMENADTVRRIAELHPSLTEAANHIAAAVHEEAATGSAANQGSSSGYSYSLDALSDEEEMDSSQMWFIALPMSDNCFLATLKYWRFLLIIVVTTPMFQSSDSQPRGSEGLSRQQSYSTITAAQLAAALASATGLFPASSRTNGSGTSTGAGPSSSSSLITPEMFSQAMQQAIANVGPNTGPSDAVTAAASSGGSEGNPDMQTAASGLSRQLQQMHELGLTDDAINVQALQATGGDVHAAIDIVFSGALPPDTHKQEFPCGDYEADSYTIDDDYDCDEFIESYNENENEFRQNKTYIRDMEDPLEMYNDQQFKRRYRFDKNTVVNVLVPLISIHNTTMRLTDVTTTENTGCFEIL
ncbi:hypothetical protein ANN_13548 [Periplaneta americana]|uniref:Ubiquitin-like protein 7 n=1 Tax=Periplaneta americana TaxID=6978 RepID=A0ABQ8TK66_PERAM|nr:hypothetical protein ANN_13548 [Periplaneta americana]